tara:strand:+ start:2019 stop:2414 length:396 start_codon:yes stop_codon:yes gene_type:complete
MKKITFIILMLIIANSSYSQTTANDKINQIKTFFQKNCLAESEKTVYYNKAEKILEFDGYQVPFMDIKAVYRFNDEYYNFSDFVYFECKYENKCIIDPKNNGHLGFSIPFASKSKSYQFINLISELREFYE